MKKSIFLIMGMCVFLSLVLSGQDHPCNESIPDRCTRKREVVVVGETAMIDCSKRGTNCEVPRVGIH